jgi:hypothetical protein
LWAFPLYYLLVHAHYKRFIELLLARGGKEVCRGKCAAVLTTSIHFFDQTAHEYLRGICDDLGLKYVDSYSAEMYDLLVEKERQRFLRFGEDFLRAVAEKPALPRRCRPVEAIDFRYQPGRPSGKVDTAGKKILIVADSDRPEGNLALMVARLRGCFQNLVNVFNPSLLLSG